MIHVIAVITAKPGMRDSILQAFRANVPAVRAEKGCIEYGAAVDAENALSIQTRYGAGHLRRRGKVGKHGRAEGPRRRAAHGGLRGEDEGDDREPRDPHPVADVTASAEPMGEEATEIAKKLRELADQVGRLKTWAVRGDLFAGVLPRHFPYCRTNPLA